MLQVHVNAYIHAPPERVFPVLSDHVQFLSGGRIKRTRIVTPGKDDPNGLGCVREVQAAGLRLSEEITHFEPPLRMDYQIIKSSAPITHDGGSLVLTPRGEGTEVNWTSAFAIPIPLLGGGLGLLSKGLLTEEFTRMLLVAKERLEG